MKPPNVLLVCADHLGACYTRPNDYSVVMTPTIGQLARLGVRYPQACSAVPVCVAARRALMTGLTARSHGDREFQEDLAMPSVPTLAQCFRDAGYQAAAVGKLHVAPPRSRIGFDDVVLNEEGRHTEGLAADDYEQFLADRGHAGMEFSHGGCTNDYNAAPWNLPEELHPTNWAAREMCRTIRRRDPSRPGFWYLSFTAPHPPLIPPPRYLDMYRDIACDDPAVGDWAREMLPFKLRAYHGGASMRGAGRQEILLARRAFYALITHLDHQLRLVLGTLREEGLLENTAIVFTSDHGEMLGDHGLWGKTFLYERSVRVPLIVVPPPSRKDAPRGVADDRLAELRDIMPTLLDLCGLPVPETVEGHSLFSGTRRPYLYAEHGAGEVATRMIRDGRHKLIYYPEGNRWQFFDHSADPSELNDLSDSVEHAEILSRFRTHLAAELYGGDESWVDNGQWTGLPAHEGPDPWNARFGNQRGYRFL